MEMTAHPFQNSGSNRITFIKHAGITLGVLLIILAFQGSFSSTWILPLIFTPIAAGIGGIIFKNTEELRYSSGLKQAFGWVIGIAGYLLLIPMALAL
ncbi:hypothetical protein [Algoriphagus algorifonticola]|uniref:hypothetical protein n=1 Tax=Algoriphagus algorifonticola TaxID=2593007 RepID=UPI0011A60913|nr:hypothetical protein [Algoriphagus algorifonticola]